MWLDFQRGPSVNQYHDKRIKDCFMPERLAEKIHNRPTGVILWLLLLLLLLHNDFSFSSVQNLGSSLVKVKENNITGS